MTDKEIVVTNLGPIEALTIKLEAPGITVITAPNGAGKSIFLDAMESLVAGDGGLPLRDGADRGSISGLGIFATILPKQTRCAGEFQLANLEGRLDLSRIVDPGISDPAAADKRRIRALVSLSGHKADSSLFTSRPEFDIDVFSQIVQRDTLDSEDLVEMAQKITRDYQTEARQCERMASEYFTKSRALAEQCEVLDTTAESDPDVLQERYAEAASRFGVSNGRYIAKREKMANAAEAAEELEKLGEVPDGMLEKAEEAAKDYLFFYQQAQESRDHLKEEIAELQQKLSEAVLDCTKRRVEVEQAERIREAVRHDTEERERLRKTVDDAQSYEAPTEEDLNVLKEEMAQARKAMDVGVRLRDAEIYRNQIELSKEAGEALQVKSQQYRQIGRFCDAVLCDLIQTESFKVESKGKDARLLSWHAERGDWVPYHDLSEAEKWCRAVDEGITRVGEGGLLLIKQEAWEGIDIWNRRAIHLYAVGKPCYILTAEATRNEKDGREFQVKQFAS